MKTEPRHPDARLLVVDDEEANVVLLERFLAKAGYTHVVSTTDPREISELVREERPDLVLLDLHMPHLDGFAVMELLREANGSTGRPAIVVLTADATAEVKHRGLGAGAHDYLTKPLDVEEVLLRIANILEIRFLGRELLAERDSLERRVHERTKDLEEAQTETFERLALAAEFRDDATGDHTRRVGSMAALIAETLGLPADEVATLRRAAALHDIGKIGVPDAILLAPRSLTEQEFEIVKTHTTIGARILSGSRSPALRMAEIVAWSHHERWDGSGYGGIAGSDIPVVGRITTVADVFDALTHERPYKTAWPLEAAIEEIQRVRGRQFDPDMVDAFMQILGRLPAAELAMFL
jgi:putative two-component system response regulator